MAGALGRCPWEGISQEAWPRKAQWRFFKSCPEASIARVTVSSVQCLGLSVGLSHLAGWVGMAYFLQTFWPQCIWGIEPDDDESRQTHRV